MIRNIITLFFVLLTVTPRFHGAPANQNFEQHVYLPNSQEVKTLLDSVLQYKKDGKPLATVGIIPYAFNEVGEIVVLVGREGEGRGWSDFGGKPEAEESFLAAIQRELNEESVKVYEISANVLYTRSPILYIHKPGARQIVYALCEVPYYPSEKFIEAREKAKAEKWKIDYLEKDKFAWVSLASLKASLDCVIKTKKLEISGDNGNIWEHFVTDFFGSTRFKDLIECLESIKHQYNKQKEAA
jgi:ADP-ribose pyrophosphatase YjhB (NUDIX family)